MFRTVNSKIYTLFFSIFALYLVICYFILSDLLNTFTTRSENRLSMVAYAVELSIADASQTIYGIATSLSNEVIDENNSRISNLISSFIPMHLSRSVPFSELEILDADDRVIINSKIPNHIFIPGIKEISKKPHFINSKKHPFQLVMGNIYFSNKRKKTVIPLCISIMNKKQVYIGAICTNLLIEKILEGLGSNSINLHHNTTLLLSAIFNKKESIEPIEQVFTLSNIFKSYFKNKPLLLYKQLLNYPIIVEMEVNYNYLNKKLGLLFLYYLGVFCLFVIFSHCLLVISKNFYQKPFERLQNMANELQLKIASSFIDKQEKLDPYNSESLISSLEHIIEHCNLIYETKNHTSQETTTALNQIFHLILTEHNDHSANQNPKENIEIFYLEHIKNLVNEKPQTAGLASFLRESVEYCYNYHCDLNIKIHINKKDDKSFTFKHAALTETIFHIFSMITRISAFNTDTEFLVRAFFENENLFPTITIEADISDSPLQPMGYESGSSYTYSSLLPIYLLAQKNNLFFQIERKDKKIIFILEPFNDTRLKDINKNLVASDKNL